MASLLDRSIIITAVAVVVAVAVLSIIVLLEGAMSIMFAVVVAALVHAHKRQKLHQLLLFLLDDQLILSDRVDNFTVITSLNEFTVACMCI